jgi:hypothetical protein
VIPTKITHSCSTGFVFTDQSIDFFLAPPLP